MSSTDVSQWWLNWCSGECLVAPELPGKSLPKEEIARLIVMKFRYIAFDWSEGDRWVAAHIQNSIDFGFEGAFLEADYALRGQCLLVTLSDSPNVNIDIIRFYLTPDTGLIDLNYQYLNSPASCSAAARKLATIIGYKLEPM
jgi:hypothetical protein